MAQVLKYDTEIQQGSTIQSWHISQSVDALTAAEAYDISISGSFNHTGSANIQGNITVGFTHINPNSNTSIVGGVSNSATSTNSFIGGGIHNDIDSTSYSSIVGGSFNTIENTFSSIVGGSAHNINGAYSFIGGGKGNQIIGDCSFIGGGFSNSTSEASNVIGGGAINTNQARYGVIGGGRENTITPLGSYGGILGGIGNCVNIESSFIVGSDITTTNACTTYVNNLFVTGSTSKNSIIQLSRRETTPFPSEEGMIISSGSVGSSKLYYYDGSVWNPLF